MKTEIPRVGQYELRQRLRRDKAGEVWRAYDDEAQRIVMLKLFDVNQLESFTPLEYLNDVKQIASLHHPNIVRIHDILTVTQPGADGPVSLLCLALDYIEGESLANFMRSTTALGKMPLSKEVVNLFSSLALALENVHQHGIVHGNLKPTNILLGRGSSVSGHIEAPVITDFAALRPIKGPGGGIPFYLAPEQLRGMPATKASDIYSLGILLYELYTGSPPFRGNRPIAVMMQHVSAQPTAPDLVNPSISPALTQVILRCLAKDPQDRFPSAIALAVALANALHVELPEGLRHAASLISRMFLSPASQEEQGDGPMAARLLSSGDVFAGQDLLDSQGDDAPPLPGPLPGKRKRASLFPLLLVVLVLLSGSGLGAWLFILQRGPSSSNLVGHAFFVDSSALDANTTTQGLSDQLQIDLLNIPDPAPGKSYYGWLLGDADKSEAIPVALGRLNVQQGVLHMLYQGDNKHANLFSFISRFLINEDNTENPSSNPLLNQSTWRYYAEIPQDTRTTAQNQNGILDHLRHLLVEAPELAARSLHGGLVLWFVKELAIVSDLANGLSNGWQRKDADALRERLIRILDYLDGKNFAAEDLPKGTPFLADSQIAQIALLGEDPANDENASPYEYEAQPPAGYVYLLQLHLNGAVLSPQATTDQRQMAARINAQIDSTRRFLNTVYADAKKLLSLSNEQLLSESAQAILRDLSTQMQYASLGEPGNASSGSHWIYTSMQRLATFNVAPYTPGA